ncbi:hypothetical protein TWF718_007884 [Orbilia javanica]|uniref:NACHT domain-containing protein n=1 Tax=Orbilia javanica TaxID=47235 RepID=A0AAN8MPN4_9PEZI
MDRTFNNSGGRIALQGSIENQGVIHIHSGGGPGNDGFWQRRILNKLYTRSLDKNQKDPVLDRIPGTCEWFTSHTLFKEWEEKKSSLLWISADPGCGKSVLAKHLVDSVLPTTASRTTCYFFFKDGLSQNLATAFCCILFQIFRAKSALLSEEIREFFDIVGEDHFVNSFDELWVALTTVAKNEPDEIVCVLDGIDECKDRSQLVRKLCDLYRTQPSYNLKFIVTSRPYRDIRQGFQPLRSRRSPFFHLRGEEEMEKISGDISIFIDARVQDIADIAQLREDEQSFLLEQLKCTPNRTYLWADLILRSIEEDIGTNIDITRDKIFEIASELPTTLDEAYEKILSRSTNPEKARKILHIVVAATRPLTLHEMLLALTLVDHGSEPLQTNLAIKPEARFHDDIRDLCCHFITIVESRIYLFHQTAREFLVQKDRGTGLEDQKRDSDKWRHSLQPKESHRMLANICIQNLLLSEVWDIDSSDGSVSEDTKSIGPDQIDDGVFLDYSTTHWATHLHGSGIDETTAQLVLRLCDATSMCCLVWFRFYWGNHVVSWASPPPKYQAHTDTDCPTGITTLMLVSYFGLAPMVKLLLDSSDSIDVNSKDDTYGRSVLGWVVANRFDAVVGYQESECDYTSLLSAAQSEYEAVVSLLLDHGADIDAKDKAGYTPLAWAAERGYQKLAHLLIDRGADIGVEDEEKFTPLLRAAQNGHEEIVRLLLDRGADIESKGKDGRTPLIWAAEEGYSELAELLVAKGVDKTARGGESNLPPRALAIQNNHLEIFQVLAEEGSKDPLIWAARYGYPSEVQMLLQKGADIERKDDQGRTALYWAVANNRESTVKVLLENGANAEIRSKSGALPITFAAMNGHPAITKLLIDKGVDVNAREAREYAYTPLIWTADKCFIKTAGALLEAGADPNLKDHKVSRTPLFWASVRGFLSGITLLVEKGANIEERDSVGNTPLLWAAENGKEAVVRHLVEKGADIECVGVDKNSGSTPISLAAWKGFEAIVKFLIEKGADINVRDNFQRTPLYRAAGTGKEAVVRLLAENGADVSARRGPGGGVADYTPLLIAAESGHEAVVRILLEKGADKDERLETSLRSTALILATKKGREAIVRLLLEKGADLTAKETNFEYTALIWAGCQGYEAIAQILLEHGADIKDVDKFDRTAFVYAVKNGHEGTARILLDSGSDIEKVETEVGYTPLLWAAVKEHERIARMLLEKGADMGCRRLKSGFDRSPLVYAVKSGNEAVVRALLDYGADVEAIDTELGHTPLVWAAIRGYEPIARLLVEKGADMNFNKGNNGFGRTPLWYAVRNGKEGVFQVLLDNGADIEAMETEFNQTPLLAAVTNGYEALVRILLDRGANMEARTKSGRTSLSIAVQKQNEAIVRLLLDKGADPNIRDAGKYNCMPPLRSGRAESC